MRFFVGLFKLACVLLIIFFAIGYFAPVEYSGRTSKTITLSRSSLWQVANDVGSLPKRRSDITSFEVLRKDGDNVLRWREGYSLGRTAIFEVIERVPEEKLVIEMMQSSFGMRGTWTYEFSGEEVFTTLAILEKSETQSIWHRAWKTILGRNSDIRSDLASIERAAAERSR